MPPCTIYALVNPFDGNVFYVGKTTEKIKTRFRAHLCDKGNKEKYNEIQHILSQNTKPSIKILEEKPHPEYKSIDMGKREKKWVLKMMKSGHRLTNKVYAKKQMYV